MSDRRIRGETEEGQRAAEGPSGRPPHVPVEGRKLAGCEARSPRVRPLPDPSGAPVAARMQSPVVSMRPLGSDGKVVYGRR